jgi:hypothetical protein
MFKSERSKYFAGDSTTLQKLVNKKYRDTPYGKL